MDNTPGTFDVSDEKFWFDLPAWFIVLSRDGQQIVHIPTLLDKNVGMPFSRDDSGEVRYPIFTDKDLAARFTSEQEYSTAQLVRVETIDEFYPFLLELQALGVTRILFDPGSTNHRPQSHPIERVIHAIKQRFNT